MIESLPRVELAMAWSTDSVMAIITSSSLLARSCVLNSIFNIFSVIRSGVLLMLSIGLSISQPTLDVGAQPTVVSVDL